MSAGPSPDGLVRPARPADAAAIADVHVATWQHAYAGLLCDDFLASLDVAQRAERWHTRLTELADGVFVLVFEHLGQVRGFVSAGPSRNDEGGGRGEVYAIYVDPRSQAEGAGSRLLDAAARRLAESAFTEATLWVLAGNAPARRFYEARGWRSDAAVQPWTYADGESLTQVRYATRLAPRPGGLATAASAALSSPTAVPMFPNSRRTIPTAWRATEASCGAGCALRTARARARASPGRASASGSRSSTSLGTGAARWVPPAMTMMLNPGNGRRLMRYGGADTR